MQFEFSAKKLLVLLFYVFAALAGVKNVFAQEQAGPDSGRILIDSTRTDTSMVSDSLNIRVYHPDLVTNPFPKPEPNLYRIKIPEEKLEVERDSTGTYTAKRTIMGLPSGIPQKMTFEQYAEKSKENSLRQNWKELIDESTKQQKQKRGLLDFKINIPGGQKSAFTTIFGKPQVNLKVNGTANMNIGASIQKTANPSLPPDQQTRIDPTFNQNLKLNIQGTIGDKLNIRTDWDTERAFDFQNRLNIVYTGYEDEILKKIEMGNVSMETGNSLIRGGGALFGIKSVAELGPLRITSVVSQQEGKGNTETITGGAQEEDINIRPSDYEDDKNFFLDFYTRQQFDQNMSNPQQRGTALDLVKVDVWVLNASSQSIEGQRRAIAMVDYGVVGDSTGYLPPDETKDRFTDQSKLDSLRNPEIAVSASDFNVRPNEFVEGRFVPLQEGVDYDVDRALGYITLKRNLNSKQALAVAFSYTDPITGQTHYVGDINQGGNNRLYLKLIRPQTVTTSNKAWDLTMRNIYNLNASDLKRDGLTVDVQFNQIGSNVPQSSLPGRDKFLLEDLGLDRVDVQGAIGADNQIDFSTGTLDPASGRIIFPYLEPFGNRIKNILEKEGASQATIDQNSFTELYNEKKSIADQNSKNNLYQINGKAKGAVSNNYFLNVALVKGSVHVYSNGVELQEGSDYTVDYSIGSITILNDRYLKTGQEIKIEYESNQLVQIGQKNFTGVRAEYNVSNDFQIGSTFFKLKERPLQDKIRIGDEPINNSVIGLDAKANFDAPWLTRAIDKVPFLQTKESSNIKFSGEFAQLRPGVAQTNAINRAIKNNDLYPDEKKGVSFIDDFEGVETNISFKTPSRWHLAAAPAAIPGYDPDAPFFTDTTLTQPNTTLDTKIARSDLRADFSWYTIPLNLSNVIGETEVTPESKRVKVTDVFPGRDYLQQEEFISTLDVHYDPTKRGPYNYNMDLKNLLENEPERMWGGMTAVLPSGLEDLTQNNIEFLEFWVQSILPDGRTPTASDLEDYNGKIYIDVGTVSEDVVPNFRNNSEDGLVEIKQNYVLDQAHRSYIQTGSPEIDGQFSNQTRELEDVGLDGAPDNGGIDNKNEQVLFSDFLQAMKDSYGANSAEYQKIKQDPSNDDYYYFGQHELDGQKRQERFYRMYGYHEGNTPQNQGDKRAITNHPDAEGLVTSSIVEKNNSYYEYEINWNPADTKNLNIGSKGTHIVDKVPGPNQESRWYQVRVPLKDFIRKIGNITDLQNVSYIRIWMSGYSKPFTIRFAKLELVGSQWKKADNVNQAQGSNADFRVSSINVEENGSRQPIPYRQPNGAIRATNRGQQQQTLANEQSVVLQTKNLGAQDLKMVKKVYPGGLNLINYSHMRMFVHGEGYKNRKDMELVMRFGTDLMNNYYEYRQPVTPTDSTYDFTAGIPDNKGVYEEEAKRIWLSEENGLNIILSRFNQLKQLRDQEQVDPNTVYERSDILKEAPKGATVAIKGNPSLDRVTEIGMGIKNPYKQDGGSDGVPFLDGQLWLNELRVSGFDDKKGWAANAKASMKLADFATLNANLVRQTDGFGALDSRLGQRRLSNVTSYDLSSTVNLDKFIPSRYGWNLPVTLSMRRSTTTPRFLPNQGDIRLSEYKDAVNARQDISEEKKRNLISQKVMESQDYTENYSVNISNFSKQYSKTNFAKYTLDKTKTSFVYNQGNKHDPEFLFQNNWNYNGSVNYNLSFSNVQLMQPFGFLGNVPVLDYLAGLRLGYMPSSINASAGISRQYNEKKRRPLETQSPLPIQQSHVFNYDTNFGLSYNLTPSITTSFQSQTTFDLSNAGIEPIKNPANPEDSTRYRVKPTFQVFNELFTDTLKPRRNDYRESYSASFRPKLRQIDALNWLNYTASYSGGYRWNNSAQGSQLGARVSNNLRLDQSVTADIQQLLENVPFYKNMKNADNEETRERNQKSGSQQNNNQQNDEREKEGKTMADHLVYYGRKVILAGLSMQSIDLSYSKNKQTQQTGYAGGARIFDMFNGPSENSFSPPFDYRIGLSDDIGRNQLVRTDENIRLPSNRRYSDNLTLNTSLNPFKNLSIDLSWSTKWDKTSSKQDLDAVLNQSGNISSSVWAFGGGYGKLFRRQLQTAFDDISDSDTLSDARGNQDGRTVLDRVTLQEDFRKAYLGAGNRAIGGLNLTPIPKPNWKITWSGWEDKIPFLNRFISRASLTHRYSGTYRIGWGFNADSGPLAPNSFGAYDLINNRPEHEPTSINLEKKFSPLVGLNLTWESNIRTQLEYEYSKMTSLALSNSTVTDQLSRGLKFSFSYTIRGFKLPFFKKIKNAVDFTVNSSYIEDTEHKYVLSSDLENALTQGPSQIDKNVNKYDFTPRPPTGQSRVKASAIIGYQFSQTIKANFEYSFNKLIPKSSGVFARTDHDIKFNIIVSIRSS